MVGDQFSSRKIFKSTINATASLFWGCRPGDENLSLNKNYLIKKDLPGIFLDLGCSQFLYRCSVNTELSD